ncbi:MAG: hypothetical protein PSV16_05155 [Flavobacterium sp.]|nr:hypothetical protein [Flavobacterium sp.]
MKKPDPKTPKTQEDQLANMHYPPAEDIFNKLHEATEIDPEDISKNKNEVRKSNTNWNEKDFKQDKSGSDLDIPGAELDDAQEATGSEDEENNGYSIGGDDHNDLEENQGA